jgi:NAD(P)H dehydrogenase (quinone)
MSSTFGTVLVYGAAGAQGSAIVRALLAEGATVRVLLRPGTANPFGHVVDIVRGDMADREKLWLANLGVDSVVLTLPTIPDHMRSVELGLNAIEAARAAGVKLLVFNEGGPIPAERTGVGLIDTRIEVEAHLRASGIPAIMIRPTVYMDNIAAWSAPAIVSQGVFAYPLPADCPASWISWSDLAAFVVAALQRPELAGHAYHIGGPDALSGTEVADLLWAATGRPVAYAAAPLVDFARGVNAAYGNTMGDEIAAYYAWVAAQPVSPLAIDILPALADLPIRPTRFSDWVKAQDWRAIASNARAA